MPTIQFDQHSLSQVEKTLDIVHDQIGLIVNYDKTVMYRIGSLQWSSATLYTKKTLQWTNKPIKVLGITLSNECDLEINYDGMLDKIKDILKSWTFRNPTLMGRVLLINSLVGSLYVYKMNVLPNLSAKHIKAFETIVRKFLWKEKKSCIALSLLQADKEYGGLRLVHLQKKETSLKVLWVKEIFQHPFFARIFYNQLNSQLQGNVWHCNLYKKDIYKLCRSVFWADVLLAWNIYKYQEIQTCQHMLQQKLWGNSLIRINNSIIGNNLAWQSGLIFVSDLYINSTLLSYEQIVLKFGNIMSWFEHQQLVDAVPILWRQSIERQGAGCHRNLVDLSLDNITARTVYTGLIQDQKSVVPKFER